MSEIIEEGQTTVVQQKVDRGRRYWFISRLTAFCLITAGAFALMTGFGWFSAITIIELYVRSLLTLATAAVMAYITGSVIDYNGGIGNIFSREQRNVTYNNSYGDEPPRG